LWAARVTSESLIQSSRAILKALEKDRDLRHHSAADLRTDLKRLKKRLSVHPTVSDHGTTQTAIVHADGTGTRRTVVSVHPPSPSDTQLLGAIFWRHRVWAGAAAALVVMAMAAAAWLTRDEREANAALPPFSNLQVQLRR
jgi:hypothetical protein